MAPAAFAVRLVTQASEAEIEAVVRGVGDVDTVLGTCQELLDAGVEGLIFNLADAHDLEAVAFVGETLRVLFK